MRAMKDENGNEVSMSSPNEPAPQAGPLAVPVAPEAPVVAAAAQAAAQSLQQQLEQDLQRRHQACAAAIDAALSQHRCVLDVSMTISPNGITPRVDIVPLGLNGQPHRMAPPTPARP
jgi:hypothetical protein